LRDWFAPFGIPEALFAQYARTTDHLWEQDINYIPPPIFVLDAPNIYIGTPIIIDDRRAEVIIVEERAS